MKRDRTRRFSQKTSNFQTEVSEPKAKNFAVNISNF